MVRHEFLLSWRELRITFGTNHDALIHIFHNLIRDDTVTVSNGANGTFIHEIRKFSTREARRLLRDLSQLYIIGQLFVSGMNTQDLFASPNTRQRHGDFTIETTRAKECIVENVDTIRGGDDNNTSLIIKTIHFREKLINGLFAFIIRRHATRTALLTHSIDLINEDDTRLIFTSNFKKVANPLGTHTDKHFNKVCGRALNERNIGFTCDSASEKSLTCTRLTREEGTAWDFGPTSKVSLGLLEKIHNLLEFIFGSINTFNITETGFDFRFGGKILILKEWIIHGSRSPWTTQHGSKNKKDESQKEKD